MSIIGFAFILILIFASSAHGVFLKYYGKNYPGEESDSNLIYSAVLGFAVAFITFAVSGFNFKFSVLSLILGFVNGIAVIIFNRTLATGTELGSYSIVMISALSSGIIMPLCASVILDGLPGVLKLVGILLMLVAFVLLCVDFKDKTKAKPGFYIACIGVFLSNGTYGILNALENRFESGIYNNEFIIVTYVTTAFVSSVILFFKKRSKAIYAYRQTGKSLIFNLLGAACTALLINFLMLTFKYISPEIVYTVMNGGTIVVSAFLSLLLFKEHINFQKWCGIVVAVFSVVILAL